MVLSSFVVLNSFFLLSEEGEGGGLLAPPLFFFVLGRVCCVPLLRWKLEEEAETGNTRHKEREGDYRLQNTSLRADGRSRAERARPQNLQCAALVVVVVELVGVEVAGS